MLTEIRMDFAFLFKSKLCAFAIWWTHWKRTNETYEQKKKYRPTNTINKIQLLMLFVCASSDVRV